LAGEKPQEPPEVGEEKRNTSRRGVKITTNSGDLQAISAQGGAPRKGRTMGKKKGNTPGQQLLRKITPRTLLFRIRNKEPLKGGAMWSPCGNQREARKTVKGVRSNTENLGGGESREKSATRPEAKADQGAGN